MFHLYVWHGFVDHAPCPILAMARTLTEARIAAYKQYKEETFSTMSDLIREISREPDEVLTGPVARYFVQ